MAKYCMNCGAKMEDADEFCPSCGQKVLPDELQKSTPPIESLPSTAQRTQSETPARPTGGDTVSFSNKAVVVGILLTISVLILAGDSIHMYQSKEDSAEKIVQAQEHPNAEQQVTNISNNAGVREEMAQLSEDQPRAEDIAKVLPMTRISGEPGVKQMTGGPNITDQRPAKRANYRKQHTKDFIYIATQVWIDDKKPGLIHVNGVFYNGTQNPVKACTKSDFRVRLYKNGKQIYQVLFGDEERRDFNFSIPPGKEKEAELRTDIDDGSSVPRDFDDFDLVTEEMEWIYLKN